MFVTKRGTSAVCCGKRFFDLSRCLTENNFACRFDGVDASASGCNLEKRAGRFVDLRGEDPAF